MTFSVTLIIVAVTVIAYFLTSRNQDAKSKMMFNAYQVVHHKEWWRVLSHALVHADGWHLAINMFVFYSFGTNLEAVWSDPRLFHAIFPPEFKAYLPSMGMSLMLMLYLGGVVAGSIPALKKHKDNPAYNSVGASGAVSAVLMASILLFPTDKLYLYAAIPITSWIAGILFFVYESYMNKRRRGNVAHDAHLAGAAFGVLFVALLDFQYLVRCVQMIVDQARGFLGF